MIMILHMGSHGKHNKNVYLFILLTTLSYDESFLYWSEWSLPGWPCPKAPPPHLECTKAHWMVWRCWKKSVNYILWPSHLAKRFQSNVLDYLNIYGVHSSSISCSGSWWPNSAYTVEKFIMTDYIEEEFTTVRRRVQNVGLFWGRVPSARLYWWRVHNFTLYWWGIHNLSYVDRVHTVRLHWGRVYSAGLCRGTVWLNLGRFSNSRIY